MHLEPASLREGKNRRSFRLKIECLEAAANRGIIPEKLRNIRLLKDLAAWQDAELGLTAWTSENVHSKNGHNPDLAKRWIEVRLRIDQFLAHKRTGKTLRESKKQEIAVRSENKVLWIQNGDLLAAQENYQKQLRMATRDLEIANNRLREAGLQPVRATFQVL